MTPRQTELAKRICPPIQTKVMVMREKYAVEEVAKSLDRTAAEIDQIEAEGWLKLGSYAPTAKPRALRASVGTLTMMRARNIHPDAIT